MGSLKLLKVSPSHHDEPFAYNQQFQDNQVLSNLRNKAAGKIITYGSSNLQPLVEAFVRSQVVCLIYGLIRRSNFLLSTGPMFRNLFGNVYNSDSLWLTVSLSLSLCLLTFSVSRTRARWFVHFALCFRFLRSI